MDDPAPGNCMCHNCRYERPQMIMTMTNAATFMRAIYENEHSEVDADWFKEVIDGLERFTK
jgi:hypothetical protein